MAGPTRLELATSGVTGRFQGSPCFSLFNVFHNLDVSPASAYPQKLPVFTPK